MGAANDPTIHYAIVSIGSNIDKEQNVPRAVTLLAETGEVVAVAPVYEAQAIGSTGQPNFFNTAVMMRTSQTPEQLKQGLLGDIEQQLMRVRTADKNAPRTIDLDISWFDNAAFDYQGLDGKLRQIPDPDLLRFAHVALPLADLLPADAIHPITGEPIRSIRDRLLEESMTKAGPTIRMREDIDLSPLLTSGPEK